MMYSQVLVAVLLTFISPSPSSSMSLKRESDMSPMHMSMDMNHDHEEEAGASHDVLDTFCPVCGMVGQDNKVWSFNGNQKVYGCTMKENHHLVFGADPEKYFSQEAGGMIGNANTEAHCTGEAAPDMSMDMDMDMHDHEGHDHRRDAETKVEMRCPVCQMSVTNCSHFVQASRGQRIYTCSEAHAKEMQVNASHYSNMTETSN